MKPRKTKLQRTRYSSLCSCYLWNLLIYSMIFFKGSHSSLFYIVIFFSCFAQLLVAFWYSTVPLGLLALLSGGIFYLNDFEKPALWISLYAGFIRNIWGFFLSVIVTGIAMGTGCKQFNIPTTHYRYNFKFHLL